MKKLLGVVISVLLLPGRAVAVNSLTNGSFEMPDFHTDPIAYRVYPAGSNAIPGWGIIGETDVTTDYYGLLASDGHQMIDLAAFAGYDKGVQSNAVTVVPNTNYILTFDIGSYTDPGAGVCQGTGFSCDFGTSVGVAFNNDFASEQHFYSSTSNGNGNVNWSHITVNWNSGNASQVQISFLTRDPANYPNDPGLSGYNYLHNPLLDNIWLEAETVVAANTKLDFNGDTKSDILWRNTSTGENYLYMMNSNEITGGFINTLSGNWQVKGQGDYNGDGKADILWRNSSTGANYLYLMNAATPSEAYLNTVATDWDIKGSGDYNGDGKADILWRNINTGENIIYLMNGSSVQSATTVNTVPGTWDIKGSGDYNGDGKSDILWRNSTTGANYIYFMNGATISSTGAINSVNDPNWQIVGSGDYNGDGMSDILWRNSSTGVNYLYQMNGTSVMAYYIDTVAPAWEVKGTGDYNGDGKADILWRNSATGTNYLYLMNGAAITNALLINTVAGSNWQIQNQL